MFLPLRKREIRKRRGRVVSPGWLQPGIYSLQFLTMTLYCPDRAWTLSLRSSKSHDRRQAGRRLIPTQGSLRCMSNIKGQKRTGEWGTQEVEVHGARDSCSQKLCSDRVLKKDHSDWSGGKDTRQRQKSKQHRGMKPHVLGASPTQNEVVGTLGHTLLAISQQLQQAIKSNRKCFQALCNRAGVTPIKPALGDTITASELLEQGVPEQGFTRQEMILARSAEARSWKEAGFHPATNKKEQQVSQQWCNLIRLLCRFFWWSCQEKTGS